MNKLDKTSTRCRDESVSLDRLVQTLTDQLKKDREQRVSNLKNAVSVLRAATMGLETIMRKAVDVELHHDVESMHGLIITMRRIMESEIALETARANNSIDQGMLEAVH